MPSSVLREAVGPGEHLPRVCHTSRIENAHWALLRNRIQAQERSHRLFSRLPLPGRRPQLHQLQRRPCLAAQQLRTSAPLASAAWRLVVPVLSLCKCIWYSNNWTVSHVCEISHQADGVTCPCSVAHSHMVPCYCESNLHTCCAAGHIQALQRTGYDSGIKLTQETCCDACLPALPSPLLSCFSVLWCHCCWAAAAQ